jgi:hypothetical protein
MSCTFVMVLKRACLVCFKLACWAVVFWHFPYYNK